MAYVMLLGNRLKSDKFAISFGRKDGLYIGLLVLIVPTIFPKHPNNMLEYT